MKTKLLSLLFFGAATSLSLQAQDAEDKGVRGVVTTVAETSVAIASNKFGELAYGINAQTRILKADGQAGTTADIPAGTWVRIKSSANQAVEIQIVAPKNKGEVQPKEDS